tara:strand:- start:604 stop:1116 length:513 start_codon:yes stop_codon:yes gene_type:complete
MNTLKITLSSADSTSTNYVAQQSLSESTNVTLSMDGVFEDSLVRKLTIDWGDGTEIEKITGGHLKTYREDSILNEVLYGKLSPLLSAEYTHDYVPSSTTLVKLLSAQILIDYTSDNASLFIIPFEIRAGSFYDSIGDLNIVQTNLIPVSSNSVNFTFSTEKDGHIIEAYS